MVKVDYLYRTFIRGCGKCKVGWAFCDCFGWDSYNSGIMGYVWGFEFGTKDLCKTLGL